MVRRPVPNAPKNKSKLRLSFNPDGGEQKQNGFSHESTEVETRPIASGRSNSGLSRAALERQSKDLLDRQRDETPDRPTYSKDYLQELRNSTPTTPKDLSANNSSLEETDSEPNPTLDIVSKFGPSHFETPSRSHIPSATEIREKKERRARLAKEHQANATSTEAEEYISLDAYDSDGEFKPQRLQVGSYTQPKHDASEHTRLIREDEDIAEGFEDFVDDPGRVTLSKRGLQAQSATEREAIRRAILEAQGGVDSSTAHARLEPDHNDNTIRPSSPPSDSNSDSDSDASLNDAYVLAQTRHGLTSSSNHPSTAHNSSHHLDPRYHKPLPPRHLHTISSIPSVLNTFRAKVSALETRKARLLARKAEVAREKGEVEVRKAHIQTLLEEAGREFERVRGETKTREERGEERGLESVGGTPGPT